MNVWGLFVLLAGLLFVVVAVRNSVGNLAPLVPGSGGTIGGTGTTDPGMASSGSGGASSASGSSGPVVVPASGPGLFTVPRGGTVTA